MSLGHDEVEEGMKLGFRTLSRSPQSAVNTYVPILNFWLTPPCFTLTGNQVTCKKVKQSRLSGSIRSNNCNTSTYIDTDINIRQPEIFQVRITEADINKLQEWRV
ncbi:hypothetical protein ACLB2K_040307 [Fragaria x ananassa]